MTEHGLLGLVESEEVSDSRLGYEKENLPAICFHSRALWRATTPGGTGRLRRIGGIHLERASQRDTNVTPRNTGGREGNVTPCNPRSAA
eukprot:65440-Prorocentrum_minimum.AAC.1